MAMMEQRAGDENIMERYHVGREIVSGGQSGNGTIRKTKIGDLMQVMEVYRNAVKYMKECGNPNQWVDGYPSQELIEEDIKKGNSYVLEETEIEAVFSFCIGEDPTYQRIEQGSWPNDGEYGTIHRLASRRKRKGVAKECFLWCALQCKNLRADTHEDNKIMQHLMEKCGFERCGMIYVLDGSKRIAYQKVLD